MTAQSRLTWTVRAEPGCSFAAFSIASPDGLLDHAALPHIGLPPEAAGRETGGLVLSGRGPVWLYAHLVHLAHPFAWLAVHDPRCGGGVVVARHTLDAPALGSVVPWPATAFTR